MQHRLLGIGGIHLWRQTGLGVFLRLIETGPSARATAAAFHSVLESRNERRRRPRGTAKPLAIMEVFMHDVYINWRGVIVIVVVLLALGAGLVWIFSDKEKAKGGGKSKNSPCAASNQLPRQAREPGESALISPVLCQPLQVKLLHLSRRDPLRIRCATRYCQRVKLLASNYSRVRSLLGWRVHLCTLH